MRKKSVSVFNYIDYRAFLADYYAWHKANERGFSHRRLAALLGFSSANFLKLVIDGLRNLSDASIKKIARGIGLNDEEKDYFGCLVAFDQAKRSREKIDGFAALVRLRNRNCITKVAPEQYEYFSEWYHPAVREVVKGEREPIDYDALAKRLNGSVSAARIRKSVGLLVRLGLLQRGGDGTYSQAAPLLNTESEIASVAIRGYHKAVLTMAQEALDRVPPAERENSHATVMISRNGFIKIKKRIQEFREEILQLAAADTDTQDVYHVNMLLYPVTAGAHHEN